MSEQIPTVLRILRRKHVEALSGLSRSTIYSRMAEGTFPQAVPLGAHSVGWLASEIDGWIAAQIAHRDSGKSQ